MVAKMGAKLDEMLIDGTEYLDAATEKAVIRRFLRDPEINKRLVTLMSLPSTPSYQEELIESGAITLRMLAMRGFTISRQTALEVLNDMAESTESSIKFLKKIGIIDGKGVSVTQEPTPPSLLKITHCIHALIDEEFKGDKISR